MYLEVINQKPKVHCMQKPFGAQKTQELKKEGQAVYYDKLYTIQI